jgi:hypothetical protein
MRGVGMAAAYGAALGAIGCLSFRAAAWLVNTFMAAWGRHTDKKLSKETA